MEDNIKVKIVDDEMKDSEIYALNFLINTILDYYCEATMDEEPGEAWKKGTELDQKRIPDDVDSIVKQAFKSQLKKFIK